ncbi:hypothetical protein SteCoe_25069 [Stentor coeruleus]|uniref:Uncharacterized protein n=1 Tax=Stentor coeruleus TaxID=5963 RepID=A0A1R2BG41_9CILI|nr:hypothetical protein SteCoe_25069 [Stentor coeruleus]
MSLFLYALLTFSATAECENLVAKYIKSETYKICYIAPESSDCSSLKAYFFNDILICLGESKQSLTLQGFTDFLTGFYNGIQEDAAVPTSCVKSFANIKSSYTTFINGMLAFGLTPIVNSLFTFNDFIAQLSSTYSLCKFSSLYGIFHPDTTPLMISSLLAHVVVNQADFYEYAQNFQSSWAKKNFVSAGIYFGKLFTVMTSYSL